MCFSQGRGSLLYRGDESLDPRSFLHHHWHGTVADDEMTWRVVRMTEEIWQGSDKMKLGERLVNPWNLSPTAGSTYVRSYLKLYNLFSVLLDSISA